MGQDIPPVPDYTDSKQHRVAWFGVFATLVLACIAGASQQLCMRLSETWDTELPNSFWHVNLSTLATLIATYAVIVGVLLVYRRRRWASDATFFLTVATLIFFVVSALAHFATAIRTLMPCGISVSG